MLLLSPKGRRYGYRKDALDVRDNHFNQIMRVSDFNSSSSIDLEQFCGPVKDQGNLGACTAFAGCGMREFLARKYENQSPVLSPLFLYYKERELDQDLNLGDTGSFGRTSCRAMNQFGVCLESTDTYNPSEYQLPPTSAQLDEAIKYKSGAYHRLIDINDMKGCLASGYVFVTGFSVYESFESDWSVKGYMPLPAHGEKCLGGHEVLFIGYDDSKSAFKVRNSWGPEWALGGNFYFPYSAVQDPKIFQDAWMQHLGKKW